MMWVVAKFYPLQRKTFPRDSWFKHFVCIKKCGRLMRSLRPFIGAFIKWKWCTENGWGNYSCGMEIGEERSGFCKHSADRLKWVFVRHCVCWRDAHLMVVRVARLRKPVWVSWSRTVTHRWRRLLHGCKKDRRKNSYINTSADSTNKTFHCSQLINWPKNQLYVCTTGAFPLNIQWHQVHMALG